MKDVLLYGTQAYFDAMKDAMNKAETAYQNKIKTLENIIEQINKKNTSYLNSDEVKTQIETLLYYGGTFEQEKLVDKIFEAIKNDTEIWNDADWKKQIINNYLWSKPITYAPPQQQTQTAATALTEQAYKEPKTSFSVQIPWYVYAIGGGMLLLAGIVIFGKKKQ